VVPHLKQLTANLKPHSRSGALSRCNHALFQSTNSLTLMETNPMNSKKQYAAPQLTVHGDVQEMTQILRTDGPFTDKDFPRRTPSSQLTFS
jgi:hypothetical protein